MCDNVDRHEQLVGYLYDELVGDERQAFEAHLAACAGCRAEVTGLELTRERLAAWVPPGQVPNSGLRVVRGAETPPPATVPARAGLRTWGLAAAAALVLAASAAIANLEVRVGSDGLVVRTGWAQAADPAVAPDAQLAAAESAVSDDWKAELARVQARLIELEEGLASRPPEFQAASDGRLSDAEMVRRVREIVAESETRQQRDVSARVRQVIDAFDRQRRLDMAVIQQGMGQYHGLTNAEIARQSDMINQLVRVATRQER